MQNSIDNTQDLIDSRDVIARIEELEAERDDHNHDDDGNRTAADWTTDCPDDAAELAALLALAEEAEGYAADWRHGETLIRDSYFTEYAEQLARDCGLVNDDSSAWPLNCIDWEEAARQLQWDYTGVDFDGVTYWIR